ncbi:acyltransferase family protein [Polynucleobacter sp. MWH-Aus1W21]|uniref:acyltransferase family protein n=1 Tax=Polynucleobacter sp. MWH-Aus1W21 TaxID=1855880 RepID=UPI001BFE7402|nr:acyltransferase family protein [Polynucleobacter sp. MWH-Aus1W21]QWD66558.1 acyltransferase [Polynucleobacter sp. MWH-Aus1W21]
MMRFSQSGFSYQKQPSYRPDIDGLRAVAVVSVLGYHFFPTWLKGGFIGVDIFFVISGYLISLIIFHALKNNEFSFIGFYSNRIRRIFPALLIILFSSLILGWFVLLADEYAQLGRYVVGASSFMTNLMLLGDSGYFDSAAEKKPLLHLWSLAIEEQFYLIWPFLIWTAWKLRFNLIFIIIIILVLSLIFNIAIVQADPITAFYSPLSRFWEIILGGVLAWFCAFKGAHKNPKKYLSAKYFHIVNKCEAILAGAGWRNIQSLIGLILIVVSVFMFTKDLAFPGYWALIPASAAILLIVAGRDAWVNRVFLSHPSLVWVGVISYPLYLWHWVLLSMVRGLEGELPSRNVRLSIIAVSVLLAWLTYELIEKPIRFKLYKKSAIITLALLMIFTALLGLYVYKDNGFEIRSRHQKFSAYIDSIRRTEMQAECFEIPYAYKISDKWFCELGDKQSAATIFAYGDSHALSLIPVLEQYALNKKIKILFAGTSGCPSLLGIQSMRRGNGIETYNCRKLNDRIFSYVRSNGIKSVILANRWVYYSGSIVTPNEINYISRDELEPINIESSRRDFSWALQNTIAKYSEIGVKVYLVEDTPRQLVLPRDILVKAGPSDVEINKFSVSRDLHEQNQSYVNAEIRKHDDKASIINFDKLICNLEICPLAKDGQFLYFDSDHLGVYGSHLLYPALNLSSD